MKKQRLNDCFKVKFWLLVFLIGLSSCTENQSNLKKVNNHKSISEKTENRIKLHKLEKLYAVGDFDGDGKKDTLFQHNYSKLTKMEIQNAADPFQNEWGTVVKWFFKQNSDLYLTIHQKNQDRLHLGIAQGLYFLINIGDNNSDGKDEIALVIDHLDDSRVNSCKIYSLCTGRWTLLKEFGIYEGSFDYKSEKPPVFNEIQDFLIKKNGKWVYSDYSQNGYDTAEEVGKMIPLELMRCK